MQKKKSVKKTKKAVHSKPVHKKAKTADKPVAHKAAQPAAIHEPVYHIEQSAEALMRQEVDIRSDHLIQPGEPWTLKHWAKVYSPVIITLFIGLGVYFFLIFYLFYPIALLQGHCLQLLILVLFIFLVAGLLIYLGIRSETLFVRIMSFIFVFVVFSLLLVFIIIADSLK
jgi:hypothetical protein